MVIVFFIMLSYNTVIEYYLILYNVIAGKTLLLLRKIQTLLHEDVQYGGGRSPFESIARAPEIRCCYE